MEARFVQSLSSEDRKFVPDYHRPSVAVSDLELPHCTAGTQQLFHIVPAAGQTAPKDSVVFYTVLRASVRLVFLQLLVGYGKELSLGDRFLTLPLGFSSVAFRILTS